ncbi:YgfZ/GcvT domain-containing protein [Tepidicaulis sp.]|uniref:CAF17-like 4Fe-4S cluster assembly/insertion protein YgfZ n=1 Tax=Tepidicaulis sp. TaxID=1920809 RepID=UPI003B5BB313
MASRACLLPERGILRISGPDAHSFLQGLLTQNMDLVSEDCAVYTLMQTPQGKFLFDLFLIKDGDGYLADCEAARAKEILKRLFFYKLRAKVELADQSGNDAVAVLLDEGHESAPGAAEDGLCGVTYVDPRLPALGKRVILPRETAELCLRDGGYELTGADAYHEKRMALGVPEAGFELLPEKTFPLEANLDSLHAFDFKKGCFVGQEVASRTKRRGQVRKRILPAEIQGEDLAPGEAVTREGRTVGEVLSVLGSHALIQIKTAQAAGKLQAGDSVLHIHLPDWADFTLETSGNEDENDA